MPGVALFLAELGAISGERRYTELARSAIGTVRRYLKDDRSLEISGGFSGWGGILYALTRLGQVLKEGSLTDEAETLLERLGELIPRDKSWDIIGGSAGCALALHSLYRRRPSLRMSVLLAPVANICCRTPKTPTAASAGCSMQTRQLHLPASPTGVQVSGRRCWP